MTTLPAPIPESISALTDAPGITSSQILNEWADYPTSLRDRYGRRSSSPPREFAPRIQIIGTPSRVIREVVSELNRALALPRNWDSYRGRCASPTAAKAALSWLIDVLQPALPCPSVVPGSDGSVQLEWHLRGIDLEILFHPSGIGEFIFEDRESVREEEGILAPSNDFARLFVDAIVSRPDR